MTPPELPPHSVRDELRAIVLAGALSSTGVLEKRFPAGRPQNPVARVTLPQPGQVGLDIGGERFTTENLHRLGVRNHAILLRRWNLLEAEHPETAISSYSELAQHWDLSAERIRQLIANHLHLAGELPWELPAVQALCQAVQLGADVVSEAGRAQHAQLLAGSELTTICQILEGLLPERPSPTGTGFDVLAALATLKPLLKQKTSTTPPAPGALPLPALLGSTPPTPLESTIKRTAVRLVREQGIGHIAVLQGCTLQALERQGALPMETAPCTKVVRAVLQSMKGIRYLDLEQEWFWFGPESESRVTRIVRKMLWAAALLDDWRNTRYGERVSLSWLNFLEGLAYSHRPQAHPDPLPYLEPNSVLLQQILLPMPEVQLRDPRKTYSLHDDYRSKVPLQATEHLATAEIQLLRILMEQAEQGQPRVPRKLLLQLLSDSLVASEPSLQLTLRYAPFVRSCGYGYYQLSLPLYPDPCPGR